MTLFSNCLQINLLVFSPNDIVLKLLTDQLISSISPNDIVFKLLTDQLISSISPNDIAFKLLTDRFHFNSLNGIATFSTWKI